MYWGYTKTSNFIKWECLPTAMAPDADYGKDGCFSGGGVERADGRPLLMYTGVRNVRRKNGKLDSFQSQCIEIGDGVNYKKHEGNPVICSEDIPEDGSTSASWDR